MHDVGKYFDIDDENVDVENIAGKPENYPETKRIINNDPLWIKLSDHLSSTVNMYKMITNENILNRKYIEIGTASARYHDW